MLRSSGAICIWLGSIFWLASKDPSRYLELIRVSGFMLLFYFAASSVAGLLYGLPAAVFALDSGLALLGGAVLLRFTRRLPLFEDLDAEV